MRIRNIIFDLGGVIIDIDYKKTLDAFRLLGARNIEEVYTQSKQDTLFDDFEVGKISSSEFRNKLSAKLNLQIRDKEFDSAWNAMLLDLPIERLNFIKTLQDEFRVFLFSNTNDIHLPEVFNICKRQNNIDNFSDIFEKEYYSNIFGHRKPNVASFHLILHENELNSSETIFVDDSIQHVFGARNAGLHAIHLTSNMSILDLRSHINIINSSMESDSENFVFSLM